MTAFALTPTSAAMVRWRIEDADAEGAVAELCSSLGLDSEVERLILQMLWEAEEQGRWDEKNKNETDFETAEMEAHADGEVEAAKRLLEAGHKAASVPGATIASVLKAMEDAR